TMACSTQSPTVEVSPTLHAVQKVQSEPTLEERLCSYNDRYASDLVAQMSQSSYKILSCDLVSNSLVSLIQFKVNDDTSDINMTVLLVVEKQDKSWTLVTELPVVIQSETVKVWAK